MNRVLLCSPDFYSIRYEINPWMSLARDVDRAEAAAQWRRLHDTLESLACQVEVLEPEPDWPDMVFTANAGLVAGSRFLLGNFRHPKRQGETPAYERWFATHGFEVVPLPMIHAFEGEGDALWCGDILFCGHGFRTDREIAHWLAGELKCPVLDLSLINPHFYHLDTCFCPLGDGAAMWHPPAFDAKSGRAIREHVTDLITVPPEEALRFACNSVVIDRHVLIPAHCPETSRMLNDRGYDCHPLPMSEFIKSGGACKCLVLRLS
jgi:N-dimethylarginine dimethylaminohydrolase